MSFYPQPNSYQCGPFALKYAFVMLGIFKSEDQIAKVAGSTWWEGTDEIGLSRAARRYRCRLTHFSSGDPDTARKALNKKIKKGIPCVLSVNNWEHWLTAINYSSGKYVVVDSGMDDVINVVSARKLMRLWKYYDNYEKSTSFDGYALTPKFKVQTRAKFSLDKAHLLMFKKYEPLAKKWNSYFDDVTSICKPRTKNTLNYMTFSEFLRRNREQIVNRVANWHGDPTYTELKILLDNMRFLADVYDLIIPTEHEKKALIDITALLMMYSCGKYGMNKLY